MLKLLAVGCCREPRRIVKGAMRVEFKPATRNTRLAVQTRGLTRKCQVDCPLEEAVFAYGDT